MKKQIFTLMLFIFSITAIAQKLNKIPTGKYCETLQYLSPYIEFYSNGTFEMCPLGDIPKNFNDGYTIRDLMFASFPAKNYKVWGKYTSANGKVTITVTGTNAPLKKTWWAKVKKTYVGQYYVGSNGGYKLVMDDDGAVLSRYGSSE